MHISEVKRMQAEKDFLMRHEGKHPANYNEADHFNRSLGGMHGLNPNSHGVELE